MSTERQPVTGPSETSRLARAAEAAVLTAVAEALVRADGEDAALDRLLELAAGLLDGAVTAVAVLDPDRGVLVDGPSRGFDDLALLPEELDVEGSSDALAIVARSAMAASFPDEHGSPAAARIGVGPGVVLPLAILRDGAELVVGVLLVAHADGRPLAPDERRIAVGIAGIAASIVERGLLTAAAHARADWEDRLSQVDPLTGLANRRTFDRVGELEVARAIRQGTPLAVVVVDVDGYRAAKDAAGRPAADAVLRRVAAAVGDGVRLVDTVGRWGEDEFVIIAPGSGGEVVGRRILDAIDAIAPVGDWKVRASAGVAHCPADGTSLDQLLAAATIAVERAKAGGGGAVAATTSATRTARSGREPTPGGRQPEGSRRPYPGRTAATTIAATCSATASGSPVASTTRQRPPSDAIWR